MVIPHMPGRGDKSKDLLLVVAGAAKAGTTFIFNYLAQHPEVIPCKIKEPRYFIPEAYSFAKSEIRFGKDPVQAYQALFTSEQSSHAGSVYLEGSANYFTYPGSAELINHAFPKSKIVLSFREPVSRLISCYQMARHKGYINPQSTFDEYIDQMLKWKEGCHPAFKFILEEGRYSSRLLEWQRIFGRDQLMTVWFDDIKERPLDVMNRIAEFIGIDQGFYKNISFEKQHAAKEMHASRARDIYKFVKHKIEERYGHESVLLAQLSTIRKHIEPILNRHAIRPPRNTVAREGTIRALYDYYKGDIERLAEVMGEWPPWTREYADNDVSILSQSLKVSIQ